jgi:arylsulfatase A-like enzyme
VSLRKLFYSWVAALGVAFFASSAWAQGAKPNILFIMGDDIGWMQPSIYHRGLMVGETPNIDRIGNEGAIFMHYYAEQSCTAGRNAFFTGMHPLRTGMIPPQLPGSPSYLRPGTPSLAKFLRDLGYNTGEFGKNHLGDHTDALADGAWIPGVLGLPVPPRRDAGRQLQRHQSLREPARHRTGLQEHAGAGPRRGPHRHRSEERHLSHPAAPDALVHVIRRDSEEPAM